MGKTKEYWYEAGTRAEGSYSCYVHLTKTEAKAVQKFINQLGTSTHIICDESWSGCVWCDDKPSNEEFEIED